MRKYIVTTTAAAIIAGLSVAYAQSNDAPDQSVVRAGNDAVVTSARQTPAEALQNQSRVRVIVQLEDPAESGSALGRKEIAELQSAVVDSVFGSAPGGREMADSDHALGLLSSIPVFVVNVDGEELADLQSDPRVKSVSLDMDLEAQLDQSTKLIGMPKSWKAPYRATGRRKVVAIIDTGVNLKHKFLKRSRIVAQACFSGGGNTSDSFCPNGNLKQIGGKSGQNCPTSFNENCAHGTHVAGIAAGYNTSRKAGEPKKGVAYQSKIVAIQVFKKSGSNINTAFSDMLLALDWLYKNRKKFGSPLASVNMSIGGGGPFSSNCDSDPTGSAMKAIINKLRRTNTATTISSGNDGFTNGVSMPACVSTAITVGASSKKASGQPERIAYYSNMGSVVDVMAPGGDVTPYPSGTNFTPAILSSVPGNKFAGFQGTSMAAPHVAGVFAAIRSAKGCGNKSVTQIERALEKTGKPINDVNFTRPRVSVSGALKKLGCG